MRWVVIVALLGVSNAHAEENRRAKELFDEGRALKLQERHDEACKRFAESYELEQAAGTALNLGECEERAGNNEDALAFYDGAAKVYARSGREGAAQVARDRAVKLRARLAKTSAPAEQPVEESSNKVALGIGLAGVGLATIGFGVFIYDYGRIQEYGAVDLSMQSFIGAPRMPGTISHDDCGTVRFSDASTQSKFEGACDAHARSKWLQPTVLVTLAVGIGGLAYWWWTKPSKQQTVAVIPSTSGVAVTTTFEW